MWFRSCKEVTISRVLPNIPLRRSLLACALLLAALPAAQAQSAADSVRGIQLRGLAPDQVLVLINGKRRHASAVLDTESSFAGIVPVDVNAIPPGAIDHIEILRDGAGAQYGSDAVAGVINIVLKKARTGGSASVRYGANHTDFKPTGDRKTDGQTTIVNADYGVPVGDVGYFRFGLESRDRNPTNRAGASDAVWTSWNSTPADLALDGKVVFKSGDSQQRNHYAFYNMLAPIADGVDAYSFATVNQRKSDGSAYFRYPGDPSLSAQRQVDRRADAEIELARDIGVDGILVEVERGQVEAVRAGRAQRRVGRIGEVVAELVAAVASADVPVPGALGDAQAGHHADIGGIAPGGGACSASAMPRPRPSWC